MSDNLADICYPGLLAAIQCSQHQSCSAVHIVAQATMNPERQHLDGRHLSLLTQSIGDPYMQTIPKS
jgi:hypothetical protein